MNSLSAIDLVAIICYLCAVVMLGSRFYQRQSTPQEYFLGGRRMSWLPVGISIIAADLSAITIMGTPAWAYGHNLELLWNSFGFILAAPIVITVFVPFYARLNLYTAYEYLERRFDLKVRLMASSLFLILRGMHVALVIYAPSLVIQMVTGLPAWACVMMVGALTTVYTALGGMRAVIWTDVLQFGAVSTGIILIFATAVMRVPDGAAGVWQVASDAGRLAWWNPSLDPTELTSIWAALIGGVVLCMSPLTTDQAILQRLFTTKSVRDCRQSIIVQSVLVIPVSLLLYFAGIALFAFYRSYPQKITALPNTDAIVPYFAINELPPGIAGMVIAAILSASMAVMSAGINALTTATTVDFYQRLIHRGAAPEDVVRVGRWGTVAWGVIVTFAALFAGRLGALALAYNKVSSVISGPLLGMFLLATVTRRATPIGTLAGVAVGAIAVTFLSVYTKWSFFWYGPVGCVTTFIGGLAVSLLTTPPSKESTWGLVVGYGTPGETKS